MNLSNKFFITAISIYYLLADLNANILLVEGSTFRTVLQFYEHQRNGLQFAIQIKSNTTIYMRNDKQIQCNLLVWL